jgi:adenylosuccinate synthase
MRCIAVIGAAFGDEGKGRIVDHLAASVKGSTIVVRYNGGAQAGHTVLHPDGRRHVFHHFGSGSFIGASTYFSRFFIANPLLFTREYSALKSKQVTPKMYAYPFMPLSTPYDMIINRELEIWRGVERHGSCGYGVAETVERLCNSKYKLFFKDLSPLSRIQHLLSEIIVKYVPARLAKLGIKIPTDSFSKALASKDLLNEYLRNARQMYAHTAQSDASILTKYDNIIFEGAQGLGLDERHRFFPHVTRSKPGLDNVEVICGKIGVKEIEVVYVMRAYMVRHGPGPFPTENTTLGYKDETNITNQWQGSLRFGYLDLDLISENIREDMKRTKLKLIPSIAITCLDQMNNRVKVKCGSDGLIELESEDLPNFVSEAVGISKVLVSRSPSRNMKKVKS